MKTFISDIIPKLARFSQKFDNLTLLTNQHWVVIDEIQNSKYVYIFRSNNDLLVSIDGRVEKGKWEYLGNNSLLIERKNETYLFRHGFFDENILALKVDGKDEYAFLVNENKYNSTIDSIEKVSDFLEKVYLSPKIKKTINEKAKNILEANASEIPYSPEINIVDYDTSKNLDLGSLGYVTYTGKNKNSASSYEISYRVTAVERITSTWQNDYTAFKIIFSDKKVGKLFISGSRKNKYYIVANSYKYYYKTISYAINALHYFLCYNKLLDEGSD